MTTAERVYEAICRHYAEHGCAPTYREMAAATGLVSTSSVAYWIDKLIDQRRLARGPYDSKRSIRLAGHTCPECGGTGVVG